MPNELRAKFLGQLKAIYKNDEYTDEELQGLLDSLIVFCKIIFNCYVKEKSSSIYQG